MGLPLLHRTQCNVAIVEAAAAAAAAAACAQRVRGVHSDWALLMSHLGGAGVCFLDRVLGQGPVLVQGYLLPRVLGRLRKQLLLALLQKEILEK